MTTATMQEDTGLPKTRNVFRIATETQAGWQVRMQRDGRTYSRYFADSGYDGVEAAYAAAVEWRDEQLAELGEATPGAERLHTDEVRERAWQTQTRTGVKGLGFTRKRYSRVHRKRAPYITVHWRKADGGKGYASYSVREHGAEAALKMAANRLWSEQRAVGEGCPEPRDLFEEAWPNIQRLVHKKAG